MIIKHLFIMNPVAGIKNCIPEITEKVKRAFILNTDRKDEKYEIRKTECRGDAKRIVKEVLDQNKGLDTFVRIYACGGDGTLNEVVNACVGYDNFAVCPIPVGSGNDFIKSFDNIPAEKFLDISACVRGEVIPCDVIKVGDRYSINIVSIGLDAVTGKRQSYFKRLPAVSGPMAYKLALGTSFITSMKNKIKFIVDGEELPEEYSDMTLAVAGNGNFYGGGFKATPLAEINDGLIDFIIVKAVSRFTFLKCVGDYKKGDFIGKFDFIKFLRCKKIETFSDKSFPIQFDGEIEFLKDPVIEIIPNAMKVIIPAI